MLRCLPWVVLAHLAMKASSPAHAACAAQYEHHLKRFPNNLNTFQQIKTWSNNLRQTTQSSQTAVILKKEVPITWTFQKVEELPAAQTIRDTFRALEDRKHHCYLVLVHASLADGVHRPRIVPVGDQWTISRFTNFEKHQDKRDPCSKKKSTARHDLTACDRCSS